MWLVGHARFLVVVVSYTPGLCTVLPLCQHHWQPLPGLIHHTKNYFVWCIAALSKLEGVTQAVSPRTGRVGGPACPMCDQGLLSGGRQTGWADEAPCAWTVRLEHSALEVMYSEALSLWETLQLATSRRW